MKKVSKAKEVKETKPTLNEDQPKEQEKVLSIPLSEANSFMQIIGIVLVDDPRQGSLSTHFVNMLKRHNEDI